MKKFMILNGIIFLFYSCSIGTNKIDIIEKKNVENKIIKKDIIIKKTQLEKILMKYDFNTDSSNTKFVNNKISYSNIAYKPDNLVNLKGDYLLDVKGNGQVKQIALNNLNILSEEFYKEFGKKLEIVSAYRSYKYQKGIKDRGCSDLFCSKAGFSEHQSGLAVDFWEATNKERYEKDERLKKYFEWMKIHGVKNGFTNTYQKGLKVDGYTIEPWHWRYVGKELAEYLNNNKITFAEFYYKNVRK